ncbi:MAG TPA: signal recognition particle protein [Steroidobacteraceae bacterium]|jgi:signal recognition particle subunit SRP54|nr:signal recognition particle protein [Steroidobacteraceae bacterium]
MFEHLTARLSRSIENLRGRGRITEENVAATLREARVALLEADVALPVVKSFIEAVKAKALGAEVLSSLTPGQAFIGILHEELRALMGGSDGAFRLRAQPPVVILLAGLQGAGKTTTAAKLARWLGEREKKRVLLASTDVRRPAAMLQLERLAGQVAAEYFPAGSAAQPAAIARAALERARSGGFDVLIVDTAGRLHVDEALMAEIGDISAAVGAAERLFVVDAMAGQDAVNAARAFGAALELTGVILTKADGDARGGAALSVRQVTGKPIVFMGVGEKTDALEPFDPERMAARILGMGDVVSLVEQVHRQVDTEEAQRLAQKVVKGKGFDMADLKSQLEQLQKMGGVAALMDKLPGAAVKKGAVSAAAGDKDLRRQIAMINSMTPRERRNPGIIDGSRRRRIAGGSGVQVQDVNRLLKQFLEMQRMMKSMKGGRLQRLMGAFKGGMPPGFPGR